ncbi:MULTISPECIES: cell division FtsA domain-containing protein [Clostridium]|uniref:Pilus assembly protein PilM n=1 Tax=Clostridium cibarium TaxID=2762247 RepID=A0ABR8PP58_9CLOT|nr:MULTISPECIES: cell division FtsA domain-containing protein [Clostridium]MBD7909956.1 pilus assembly protein PilM [Clostridium cibarium]
MERTTFNPRDIIFSLDIGTRSIIGTVGVVRDKKFEVICEKYQEHEERAMVDGQIHDINLVAQVVDNIKKKLEKELEIKLEEVSIAAAGRFLRTCEAKANLELNENEEIDKDIVRTIELSAVKEAESEVNKNTAGKLYCVGYSIKEYYLNSYVISNLLGHKGEEAGVDVIATFLPRSVIDSLYTVMNKVGLRVMNLTLEPIAAIEAAVPKNLRLLNIALVDIGAGTSDIAISSKETISSYAMVPMAGDEVTEVIAQEYLVDFNTAEGIKRKIAVEKEVSYIDVLGLENTILSESVMKLINPVVNKLAEAISSKILETNGEKSPSAVFLVGGGAHTPGLLEGIAEKLNIPTQRIAIKDRNAVPECVADNGLGSAGVTVLGIALSAIRSLGNDFIDVSLNGEPVSLFNSHKHTVMDVLLQAGVNPSLLIGKTGKNVRFVVNGKKRLAFGGMGVNAVIKINNKIADIESEINAGDDICVVYAQNGKDAEAKVSEFISNINSISIFIDDKIVNLEPVCLINGERKDISEIIKNEDEVKVFLPNKLEDFKKYVLKNKIKLYINDEELNEDFILEEGNKLYTKYEDKEEEVATESEVIYEFKVPKETKEKNPISVIVNKEEVKLSGKESYIFVDVFTHINFDLTIPKGNINLLLNGKQAGYTDVLVEGDEVEIFWE